MRIDKELVHKILQYIKVSDKYTFSKFADELGLRREVRRGAEIFYECPFHIDETPSLSVNEERGIFQCFSCGRKGSYVNLLLMYDLDVLGKHTNFYKKLDEILRSDSLMTSTFNKNTIFIEDSSIELNINRNRFTYKGFTFSNYLELADYVKARKNNIKDVKAFILMMQKGIPVQDIYSELFNINNGINFLDILGGD